MKRRCYLPNLYYDHNGFFVVVAALVLTHVVFGIDTLQGTRLSHSPGYKVAIETVDHRLWIPACIHFAVVLLILFGLYVPHCFRSLRWGCWLSVVLFNALSISFLFSALEGDLSFYGVIASTALSLVSLAATKEPAVNPLSAKRRPRC